MKYKYATCPMERKGDEPWTELYETRPYLTLGQWSIADCDGDYEQCGLAGSPTKVSAVKSIVFQAKETTTMTGDDADIEGLVTELLEKNIIG
jgi:electron transfer flavoprotein, beta subunit